MIKKAAETRTVAVSFSYRLWTGEFSELLTGTPTVVEVQTSALTIASVAINTVERERYGDGGGVAAGKAVEFSVSGGVAGTDYTVRVTAVTDGTPAQTLIEDIRIQVQ